MHLRLLWCCLSIPFVAAFTPSSVKSSLHQCSLAAISRREWFIGSLQTALLIPAQAQAASVITTPAVCDPCVTVWKRSNRIIYLLGTAHISTVSADLAAQMVRDVHPNGVFVELDIKRVGGIPKTGKVTSLTNQLKLTPPDETLGNIIIPKIDESQLAIAMPPPPTTDGTTTAVQLSSTNVPTIPEPEKQGFFGRQLADAGARAVGGAIRGMYKNLDQQGFQAGQEFVRAVEEGQKINADIILGDRDVEVTLRRLAQALAVTDLKKLTDPNSDLEQNMKSLLPGGGAPVTSEGSPDAWKTELSTYIEAIKTREKVTQIMSQLREVAPALVQVMLTERDAYMAAGLDTLNEEEVICAVMGIAHVDGVERNLKSRGWSKVALNCPKRT